MPFEGKVGLVTGSASGIGEACAKQLAADGAAVVVADIDHENGLRVVAEIEHTGGTATFVRADVSVPGDVSALVEHAVRTYGGLDLAVNNAGTGHAAAPLHEIPLEAFDKAFATTARGTFLCMREEIARFLARGGGAIVNIASGSGLKGALGLAGYGAAKHAVVGLTRTGALDYASRRIRINAIAPGPIATPAFRAQPTELQERWGRGTPMGRVGTPEEIAESAAFLLSDAAAYITGIVLETDGGWMQGSQS